MSCGIGHRHGLDPTLLWLWHKPVATAPIQPLAWEPPHAAGAALKRQDQKERKKERKKNTHITQLDGNLFIPYSYLTRNQLSL